MTDTPTPEAEKMLTKLPFDPTRAVQIDAFSQNSILIICVLELL